MSKPQAAKYRTTNWNKYNTSLIMTRHFDAMAGQGYEVVCHSRLETGTFRDTFRFVDLVFSDAQKPVRFTLMPNHWHGVKHTSTGSSELICTR